MSFGKNAEGKVHTENRPARRNTDTWWRKLAKSSPLKKIMGAGGTLCILLIVFSRFSGWHSFDSPFAIQVGVMGSYYGLNFFCIFGLPGFGARKRPSEYAILICEKKGGCTYEAAWATTGAHARRCEKKKQKKRERQVSAFLGRVNSENTCGWARK